MLDGLSSLGELAVATALGRKVNDHGPRLHALDHVLVYELRGLRAWDERRRDDNVHLLHTFPDELLVLIELLLGPPFFFFFAGLFLFFALDDVPVPRRFGVGVEA